MTIQGRVGNRQWPILRGLADAYPEAITAADAWKNTGLPTFGNGSIETIRRLVAQGLVEHACPADYDCPAPPAPIKGRCLVRATEAGMDVKIGPSYAGRLSETAATAAR